MVNLPQLLTIAGASLVTGALYTMWERLIAPSASPLALLIIAESVVWIGGALSASPFTVAKIFLLTLNGFVVAAATLGSLHGAPRLFAKPRRKTP